MNYFTIEYEELQEQLWSLPVGHDYCVQGVDYDTQRFRRTLPSYMIKNIDTYEKARASVRGDEDQVRIVKVSRWLAGTTDICIHEIAWSNEHEKK